MINIDSFGGYKKIIGNIVAVLLIAGGLLLYEYYISFHGSKDTSLESLLIQSAQGAQVDYFLKIEGVDGESKDRAHGGEIEILSWNWGEINTSVTGGGGGMGKVSMQDFNFSSHTSKASPKLFLAVADGRRIPEAKLSVRKAGGKGEDYLIITMKDVLVSSYQTNAGGEAGPTPIDSFSFNFSQIEYKYIAPDGSMQTHCWNKELNAQCVR